MSNPKFCWWCGGPLSFSARYYSVVKDQLGNEHRVHKACANDALMDATPITAQPRDGIFVADEGSALPAEIRQLVAMQEY